MTSKAIAPQRIVIVGGGTAGWMAASLLHHAWGQRGSQITLIESSEIPIVGVGEGSTPYMKDFFRLLGISESEWMPHCKATYKCGISFPHWSTTSRPDTYFHPFFSQLDLKTGDAFFHNCGLRRRGTNVEAHPDDFFVAAQLARDCRAPVPVEPMPFEPDYAYHFDAGELGQYLKRRAVGLGIEHIIDNVDDVQIDSAGNIESLQTRDQGLLAADLFIDCSGFAGLLINKSLNEEFHSYADGLFNDRAVAIPTPLDNSGAIPSHTTSTALSSGWAWKIPLSTRFGNGYVYSSSFLSADDAEQELRAHLGEDAANMDARHLSMRVGRVKNHWSKNCLAVGLSQGFIEPLEATALMLVQFTVQHFIQMYESDDGMSASRKACNDKINYAFDGVRDYIVAHYKLNTRTDSDYWISNRDNRNLPEHQVAILESWDRGLDFEATLTEHGQSLIYLRPNWYCILAGMGRFPDRLNEPAAGLQAAPVDRVRAYCAATASEFPSHRERLKRVYSDSWPEST